jgi:hypothetical protein
VLLHRPLEACSSSMNISSRRPTLRVRCGKSQLTIASLVNAYANASLRAGTSAASAALTVAIHGTIAPERPHSNPFFAARLLNFGVVSQLAGARRVRAAGRRELFSRRKQKTGGMDFLHALIKVNVLSAEPLAQDVETRLEDVVGEGGRVG